jgi:hypothetical protein
LPGGKGRALAFDVRPGTSPSLYAGDGPASLRRISLAAPNAPLTLRLPLHSRGARAVAPPSWGGGGGGGGGQSLAAVATAGAGLVLVSGQTGNAVATVPLSFGGGGGGGAAGGGGGPAPGMSAGAWSVAWSPLRPTHELMVGLDGGRVATVDLRAAASASSSSSSSSQTHHRSRAVVSVVRVAAAGGGGGAPIHTVAPLPQGCEASLVGGEAVVASATGVWALWRQPGTAGGGARPEAVPLFGGGAAAAGGQEGPLPPLERGASCESVSVLGGGGGGGPGGGRVGRVLVAVSVRRRHGAEVQVHGLAGGGLSEEEEQEVDDESGGGAAGNGPLRLGGHASASHMTAGALIDAGGCFGADAGDAATTTTTLYATGDEARAAPVVWRLPAALAAGRRRPSRQHHPQQHYRHPYHPPSLSAPLPDPFPSPVLAVAGARVPGLFGSGGSSGGTAGPPLLLAAASAGCVRVYQAAGG